MAEANSITVSVGAKRQAGNYEPVEVRVSYTVILPNDAGLEVFQASEQTVYEEVMARVEEQLADAVQRLQATKLDSVAVTQEAERRPTQPPAFPQPVTPPNTRQNAPQAAPEARRDVLDEGASVQWHAAKFWPKKADRQIGQFWTAKVLEFEKGEFVGPKGKPYNALVLKLEDGKYPKEVKVFHDAPAYPADGTPYRQFFKEGKYNVADKGVYCVLAITGKEYNGALEPVPMAFTTTPDNAAALLPTFE